LARTGMTGFSLMWVGQLVSLVGSGLTRFALGVLVYQQTGSATKFALIALFASLPGLLVAPLLGALVDRWNRRTAMLLSDFGAVLCTLALVLLLRADALEIWHIYLIVGVGSVFNHIQWPAYTAATTLLVPKRQFGRVSGMMQFGAAASEVVAPILAGLLLVEIGLTGVILLDFAAFLFAAATLLLVRVPDPEVSAEGRAAKGSLWREAALGWTFIRARPGLVGLLGYFAMMNLVLSVGTVMLIPMVLSLPASDPKLLGTVLSISSAGLLAGTAVMTITGGPRRQIHGVLACGYLFALAVVLTGLRPYVPLIAAASFLKMFGVPIINGSSQAIWQRKVPPDLQGRVFAVRRMIAQLTAPVGYLLAGPLADRVFEPLLRPGGALADSVGRVIGVGPGRGIALMFILTAALPAAVSTWGYLNPPLRNVEEELPDRVGDAPPVAREERAPAAEEAPAGA